MSKLRILYNPYGVEEGALRQIDKAGQHERVVGTALMGDAHQGYGVPIGGVIAYRNAVSPTGVGYDIGCGNKAVRLNVTLSELLESVSLETLADEIRRIVSFGVGRPNNVSVDSPLFDLSIWNDEPFKLLKHLAQSQLGTVGSGNHYVDVFVDDSDNSIWVGVHFGSRGLGHKLATYFLKAANAIDSIDAEPVVFTLESQIGQDYWDAMQLAGLYAYAGRDWVCQAVTDLIGGQIERSIHNNHNFAWKEIHGGEELIVVRKGATPAFPNQAGFVGATMAEHSVILEGVESSQSAAGFYSTMHGAGRVMSRTQAKGKVDRKTGQRKSEGLVTQSMMDEWVNSLGVIRRGGDVDESPHCYKRLYNVIQQHADTIRVTNVLRPLIVCMAGNDEFDPYKD